MLSFRWTALSSTALLAAVIAACHRGGAAEDIVLPSGEPGFALTCDATKTKCYKLASQKCPGGYKVVEESKMDTSEAKASAWSGRAKSRSKTDMGMVIKCSDGAADKPKKKQANAAP